jgi:hypothetical protein
VTRTRSGTGQPAEGRPAGVASPPSPSSGHRRAMLFACCWAAAAGRSLTLPTLIMGPIPSVAAGIPADVLARRPGCAPPNSGCARPLRGRRDPHRLYPTLSLTGSGASTTGIP